MQTDNSTGRLAAITILKLSANENNSGRSATDFLSVLVGTPCEHSRYFCAVALCLLASKISVKGLYKFFFGNGGTLPR